MQLGVDNTTIELAEAQRSARITRLSGSSAGRRLLKVAGLRQCYSPNEVVQQLCGGTYVVVRFHRNFHPQHDAGRRAARAMTTLKKTVGIETIVDEAAQHRCSGKFAVSVDSEKGELSYLRPQWVLPRPTWLAEQVAMQDCTRP